MTEEKRTLIETFLPVDEISAEAKIEKIGAARPPISSLHYWWTRKPLITTRTAVLGALVGADFDLNEFKKLLGLNQAKSTGKRAHYYNITPDQIEKLKKEYKKVWGEVPTILDPFAGGGTIPFEAMRLGLDVFANDYNPVAHIIEKATLEYPKKYGETLSKEVNKAIDWVFTETKKEMEEYYPKHDGRDPLAYVWAWSVKCPNCSLDNPLVGQWLLSSKGKSNIFIQPSSEGCRFDWRISTGSSYPEGNCKGGLGKCISCGFTIPNGTIKNDILQREKEQLLAVVLKTGNGYEYTIPSDQDREGIEKAKKDLEKNWKSWILEDIIPLEEIPISNDVRSRPYLIYWHKYLNPRQKLLFIRLIQKIEEYCKNISGENEFKTAIAVYLTILLGKHIDYNCRSTGLNRQRILGHALAARGIGLSWDHAEVNPFEDTCGSLIAMKNNVMDGLNYAIKELNWGGKSTLEYGSVTQLNHKVPIIVTDPPYFDDICYAELSEFFYVWERKALKNFIDLGSIPTVEELSVGGQNRTPAYFSKLFHISCQSMYRNLTDDGILIMFFAHSSIDAWDFVVNALQKSKFRITATWPIHTESTTNPLAQGKASIMSSIIIVARKRKTEKSGYIEEIQDEVKIHLVKRLDEFWTYNLRGADLTVSAMGATLDVITQYSDIKSYTGEMQIKDVLELVQKYVAQYVLNRYMKNASELDAATSFYLYTRLSQLEAMPFDTANLIAKSMNVDLKLFEKLGLIETNKKGKAQGIIVLNFSSREINPKQSLIDCVQFVMTTFAKGGYTEVESELATIPFSRNEIKDVLEALLSLPTEDPERQVAQKILERMGQSFPKQGQTGLDNF